MRAVIFDLDHTLFGADGVLHDGTAELLVILRRLGVKVAGLSSADHRVLVRLDEAGIRDHFDHVLCADQTLEPKGMSGLHHLLANLEVEAENAIMVSRAHADILLAKEAQLAKAIGITPHLHDSAPLKDAGADHIIENIPSVLDVLE
ncbi:MAG TPA: HAD family hydrolase [Patescibacteria group bacterium]|nr:HAD family hydrolase [Patescibacteria group bacterium]